MSEVFSVPNLAPNKSLTAALFFLVVILVAKSYLTLCGPMDCSPPGSSVHGISHSCRSGLPFPSPGDLPDPGIEVTSPALQVNSLRLCY